MLASVLLSSLVLAASSPAASSQLLLQSPTGHTQLLQGGLSKPLTGDLVEGARAFALARRAELGLPATSELGKPTVFGTRFGGSIHFPQIVAGFEVADAKVIVTINERREIVRMTSSVFPYRNAHVAWNVSADEAVELAAWAVPGALLRPAGGAYGAWLRRHFRVGNDLHSGYLVRVPTLMPNENWYVAIDATLGTVLWTENRVKHVKAQVYGASAQYSPGQGGVATAPLEEVELTHLTTDRPAGTLLGDQIHVFNCCPNEGCDPAGSPRRAQGVYNFNGTTVPYDTVMCDRLQRANDATNGDFVYAPIDPPQSPTVSQSEPADSDPFVEVHAFHHVNLAYDFVREISAGAAALFPDDPRFAPFQMRDEREGRKPYVWTNLTLPDQNRATFNGTAIVIDHLTRVDNAAFMPSENFEQSGLPEEYSLDADTLIIFQGNGADFGYDAPVLWHEFGHGAIYSTANFRSFVIDERGGNDEGAALHEAIADYLAGALGQNSRIGQYVGPRMNTGNALRDMNNTFSCPSVLMGESHQDSQHVSAALWEARSHFQLGDAGRTYDAAIYAALVSMVPTTSFQEAGDIVIDSVARAFPDVPSGRELVQGIFDSRGVTNCSKVLEVDDSGTVVLDSDMLILAGTARAQVTNGTLVPAPFQLMRVVADGASRVTISARIATQQRGGTPRFSILTRSGAPVTFTKTTLSVTHDADQAVTSSSGQNVSAVAEVDVACGDELYVALANATQADLYVQNLRFEVEPRGECEQVVPSTPAPTKELPAVKANLGKDLGGCSAPGAVAAQLAGLVLLTFALRRRRS